KTAMPTPRDKFGLATAGNGKVYAIGGHLGKPPPNRTDAVEEYDPATNTWAAKAPLPIARLGVQLAAAANAKLYAMGGSADCGTPRAVPVQEYDPATNAWTEKAPRPDLLRGLFLFVAAAGNGKIYAVGAGIERIIMDEYDPASNTWTTKAPVPT